MRLPLNHWHLGVAGRMASALAVLGFVVLWLSSAAGQELRTWSDKTGRFKIKAKLVETSGNKVLLEKEDGSQVAIPLDKLSEEDQKVAAEMGDNPFQTVKPAKKPTAAEEDEEPAPKRPARKRRAEEEEEPAEEGPEGNAGGRAELVTPQWTAAKEIPVTAPVGKWTLSIEAPEEPADAPRTRPIVLPPKADFFERATHIAVNPICRRAAIGYLLERRGPPRHMPGRPGGGGVGEEGQTRIVLCDLQSGKRLNLGAVPGKLVPLALSDDGLQLLLRREDMGFAKPDVLETWALTKSGISPEVRWSPHDERMPGGHKTVWAAYVDEQRFLTATSAGFLVLWGAGAKPLRYMKIDGQGRPALSPDRKYVAFGTGKGIGVLDLSTLQVVAMLAAKDHLPFPVLAFTPKGTRLVCGAHSRVLVWDVATSALYREIPLGGFNVQIGESIPCPSEGHLLLGNSLLVDMDSQARLWTYRGHENAAMLGGTCWFLVSSHEAPGALVPAALPHAAARAQIEKAMQSPDFFIVKPGSTVRLNVAGLPDAGERDKAQAALAKALEANGCQVAPNAAIELVATVETGKRAELSYRGMGGPFGGGSGTYNFQEYATRLKFVFQGQTLWEIVGSNNPGFMISLKEGETVAQFLQARERPNYAFFSSAQLPRMVQKPSAGGQTIGTSQLSVAGLQ